MGLTALGWIFLIAGWGSIFVGSVYCFGRVLSIESKKAKARGPETEEE